MITRMLDHSDARFDLCTVYVPHTPTATGRKMVRFTSIILLRVCVDVLWPKPNNPLSVELLTPLDPIKLLSHGLHHISPPTINHSLVQNRHGPSEKSIQAAL